MTRALAEVGRPGPARDVCDGGDVDPATGRLLSVGELQAALRAARAASTRPPLLHGGPARPEPQATNPAQLADRAPSTAPALATSSPSNPPLERRGDEAATPDRRGVLRPPAGRRWVAVTGAHPGAGASTVALALADAAAATGRPVQLVSCNAPAECGLVGAATVELGTDPTGTWRTGRRGARVTLGRPAGGRHPLARDGVGQQALHLDAGAAWPPLPPGVDERDLLTVVDAEPGAARAPQLLATAAAVLLVCRVSAYGVQQAEQLLEALRQTTRRAAGQPSSSPRNQAPPGSATHDSARYDSAPYDSAQPGAGPVVLVAALGQDGWSGRWPRAVRRAAGPLLSQLQATGRVVTVPLDRRLTTYQPTGSALPRPVTRSAARAVRLLEGTGVLDCAPSTAAAQHTGVTRPAPTHSAADPLLDKPDDKDAD